MAHAALSRTGEALAWAAGAALAALVSPPLALLIVSFMAARALAFSWRTWRLTEIAPPILAALALGALFGLAAGIGVLFTWRLIADTRWSLKEDARLSAIDGVRRSAFARAHLVLTPMFALAMVAYTAPHMIAGLPLDLPHVPVFVPIACGALAALALFDWLIRCAADARLGSLPLAPTAHQAAHHAIFLIAYASAQDISAGLMAFLAWRLAYALRAQPSFTAVP